MAYPTGLCLGRKSRDPGLSAPFTAANHRNRASALDHANGYARPRHPCSTAATAGTLVHRLAAGVRPLTSHASVSTPPKSGYFPATNKASRPGVAEASLCPRNPKSLRATGQA